jgi:hypothetical protein
MSGVVCVRFAVTQPHSDTVYGSRGVTSFRSKFGLCCMFTECRIISYLFFLSVG